MAKLLSNDFLKQFRQVAPYIKVHRNRVFVLYFPYAAITDNHVASFISDIILLHHLGVHFVIVFDLQNDLISNNSGVKKQTNATPPVINQSLFKKLLAQSGALQIELTALFSKGINNTQPNASHIQICAKNFVLAKPYGIRNNVDYGYFGTIRKIFSGLIKESIQQHNLVLIPPLGYSSTGEVFYLSAIELASQVAIELSADKLILFNESEGLRNKEGDLLRECTPENIPYIEQLNTLLRTKINACIKACHGGVSRSHLLSYQIDGCLFQELFTRDGCGTLISLSDYEQIRSANIADVNGITELISPLVDQGILVARSKEWLESNINLFIVIERDSTVIACAALHAWPQLHSGELACIAVHSDYRKSSRGQKLLDHIQQRAHSLGLTQLFVLTTQTQHWFIERGFKLAKKGQVPQDKLSQLELRGSLVFVKTL